MSEVDYLSQIRLDGGVLCLDFVNTIHDRHQEPWIDYLESIEDVIHWATIVGAIGEEAAEQLLALARKDTSKAGEAFETGRALRDAMYSLFAALIHGEEAPTEDIAHINRVLSHAQAGRRLIPEGDGFGWGWNRANDDLEQVLWPMVTSAADVLTSEDLHRIKQCPRCGWLFLDVSKNRSRRWCSMETCGNRTKVERFLERRED